MPAPSSGFAEMMSSFDFAAALEAERLRQEKLTPEQKKAEADHAARIEERYRKHIAFLDYCAAKKIDPNLLK